MKAKYISNRSINKANKRIYPMNVIYIILLIVIIFLCMTWNRFLLKTNINGIDCSLCTAQQASRRLQKENFKEVSFTFIASDGEIKTYNPNIEEMKLFDISMSNIADLNKIMQEQQQDSSKQDFQVDDYYNVNSEALKEYLSGIPEMQEKNQVMPQNAYVMVTEGNEVEIVKEVTGNYLDLDFATSLAVETFRVGDRVFDFSKHTAVYPEILSTNEELNQNRKEIETLLATVIDYRLGDGTVLRIDANKSKEWLKLDKETGQLFLDKEEVENFVDDFAEIIQNTSSHIVFKATGIGNIIVPVVDTDNPVNLNEVTKVKLNKEAIVNQIIGTIPKGLKYQLTPIYCDEHTKDFTQSYIELDFARQKIWVYKYGICILEASCVTGDVSKERETPNGIYFLVSKSLGATLTDRKTYWSKVNYWMPFIGSRGIGFHDAKWRNKSEFIPTTYLTDGSHGCVNMMLQDAQDLYQNIDSSMPIILYNSNE